MLFLLISACSESNKEEFLAESVADIQVSQTKIIVFYSLVVFNIVFLAFILFTRYRTRNDEHNHDWDKEEKEDEEEDYIDS